MEDDVGQRELARVGGAATQARLGRFGPDHDWATAIGIEPRPARVYIAPQVSPLPSRRGREQATVDDSSALENADRAMARYAEGHDASFGTVFETIGPRVLRFLRRLCGNDELSRDLFQETLLRMHQARGSFRPGFAVLPWAFTIARNIFLDHARAKKRSPTPLNLDADERPIEPRVNAEAESAVVAAETARAVERALAGMSAVRREAFVLIRFEGLSVSDAAEILGVSENAVKLRAFQAYETIRDELARLERLSKPIGVS